MPCVTICGVPASASSRFHRPAAARLPHHAQTVTMRRASAPSTLYVSIAESFGRAERRSYDAIELVLRQAGSRRGTPVGACARRMGAAYSEQCFASASRRSRLSAFCSPSSRSAAPPAISSTPLDWRRSASSLLRSTRSPHGSFGTTRPRSATAGAPVVRSIAINASVPCRRRRFGSFPMTAGLVAIESSVATTEIRRERS